RAERFGGEQILEPSKYVPVAAAGRRLFLGTFRQTVDQSVEQLLLQPVRSQKVGERARACFGHPDGRAVEVAQFPSCRSGRSPSCRRRNLEPGANYRAAVIGKLLRGHVNGAPVTGSEGQRV